MTTCRRRICTNDSDGEPFCSDRCEIMYSPSPSPDEIGRRGALISQTEQENRHRIVSGQVWKDTL